MRVLFRLDIDGADPIPQIVRVVLPWEAMHVNSLISVARSKASALFAALALVLVVTLTLAGCSSDKSGETTAEAKKDPSSIRVVALDWRYE